MATQRTDGAGKEPEHTHPARTHSHDRYHVSHHHAGGIMEWQLRIGPVLRMGKPMPVRILIADDHSMVRQGLRFFLELDPDLQVVGQAADGAEAVRLARQLEPDVVLMDLLMPVMDGIAATTAIRSALPDTQVLVLTAMPEDARVIDAVRAGASGYLLKDAEADALCQAVKAAAARQVQLSSGAAARLLQEVRAPEGPVKLTEREIEVLRLIADGKANKEIARQLRIAEKTSKVHVSNILSKLGMQSRTQAALYAARIGLVSGASRQEQPAARGH